MTDSNDDDYKVGYGKPPKQYQFQEGRSGNPGGRPKKPRPDTELSAFEREMSRKVWVTIDGKRRRMTKREAAMVKLVNMAIQGDARAMAQMIAIDTKFGQFQARPSKPEIDAQQAGGVLAVSMHTLTDEEWEARYSVPQPQPTIPLLEQIRQQIEQQGTSPRTLKDDDDQT